MPSQRMRILAAGAALAVAVGLLVDHGAVLGDDLAMTALFGALAGGVLALVPDRSGPARAAAFGAGLAAAWLGYLLRAGALPDIPLGRALAGVAVVALIIAVAVVTADQLPLWAGVLGAAALVGAYEAAYVLDPTEVVAESTTAVTSVLLASTLTFVLISLVQALVGSRPGQDPADDSGYPVPSPRGAHSRPDDSDHSDDSDDSDDSDHSGRSDTNEVSR